MWKLIFICALCASAQPTNDELLDRASKGYYNLKTAGLLEFRCQVAPDWDAFRASLKSDAIVEQLFPLLKQTRFDVIIGPDGASSVSRRSDFAPPNEQLAQRLRTSTTGVEQLITGFFHTWSPFMFGFHPLQPIEPYTLEQRNGEYRVTQKQGDYDVLFSMNRELVITELSVTKPDFSTVMRPSFLQLAGGALISGYTSTLKTSAGTITTEIVIENQRVEGFELPKTVTAIIGTIRIPLHFEDYRIKRAAQ